MASAYELHDSFKSRWSMTLYGCAACPGGFAISPGGRVQVL